MTNSKLNRPMTSNASIRSVERVVRTQATSDGAGVRLARSLGTPQLPQVDPFLMLDEFRSDKPGDYIAGFPSHPHRGFETVTIMLAGSMQHKDSVGNTGNLVAGSVQWMSAARGIIHSEMPKQEDGLMWGFQLWVNLPAKDKLADPSYQDIEPEQIPTTTLGAGVHARVIAGSVGDVRGPVVTGYTDAYLLDMTLDAGAELDLPLPAGHNVVVYVFGGGLVFSQQHVTQGHAVELGSGQRVVCSAGDSGARALVLAGRPIGEPVARYGPFVMNTQAELEQAVADYRAGTLTQ